MAKRFYIETSDEFGPTEYDEFDTVADAAKIASDLIEVGFKYAVIVDRNEMSAVAMLGTPPADWL
jgi:hypothetical protein